VRTFAELVTVAPGLGGVKSLWVKRASAFFLFSKIGFGKFTEYADAYDACNGTVHEITWPVTHCRSNRYQLLQDLLSKEECEALIDLMKKLPGRWGPAQLS